MNQNKLPADPLSLVLGILALVMGIAGCCCYGVTAIIPLIMSIIGLVVANKSLRAFGENPEVYDPQSRNNVNTAKIINIIALVLNGVVVLVGIIALVFYGTVISSAILDGLEHGDFESEEYYYESEYETTIEPEDTGSWEDEVYDIEDDVEAISLDSVQ